jgi:ribosome-binding factor A
LQLCRQVERALTMALEGEVLRDLTIHSVIPAPDSSRLLITFVNHGESSVAEVLAALHERYTQLRGEVAAAIHRKKTPQLSFEVIRA